MRYIFWTFSVLFCLVFTQTGCVKGYEGDQISAINVNPVRFDQLEVGQTSQYIGVIGNKLSTGEFTYTDDTLYISVIGETGNGFLMAETFHWLAFINDWVGTNVDSVFLYYVKVQNDTLRIEGTGIDPVLSRIFGPSVEKNGLPLAKLTNQSANLAKWTTDLPFCECRQEGFAQNQTLLGVNYSYLNVVMDNTELPNGGLGETYAYSKENGLVRAAQYKNGGTQSGFAWDLLPKKE